MSVGQQLDCEKFKTGNFIVKDVEYGNVLMERTKNKQTWFNEKSKLKIQSEIKWIKSCMYTVQNTKVLQNPNAIEFYRNNSTDTTRIIETRPNSYVESLTDYRFNITSEREVFKTN